MDKATKPLPWEFRLEIEQIAVDMGMSESNVLRLLVCKGLESYDSDRSLITAEQYAQRLRLAQETFPAGDSTKRDDEMDEMILLDDSGEGEAN